jgi:hypothetical protein
MKVPLGATIFSASYIVALSHLGFLLAKGSSRVLSNSSAGSRGSSLGPS